MLQSLNTYFEDQGLRSRHAKQRVMALTQHLKRLSRSQARGGSQPYRDTRALQVAPQEAARRTGGRIGDSSGGGGDGTGLLARTTGGRVKSSALSRLNAHVAEHGLQSLSEAELQAWAGFPPQRSPASSVLNPRAHPNPAAAASERQSQPQRHSSAGAAAVEAVSPEYDVRAAHAYALSRLPGCFAAVRRVLAELRARLPPSFQPRSMLDFGSGPGTAIWAAQEVWPDSLSSVTAVEASPAMARLGRRLEAGRRFAYQRAPLLSWGPSLAALRGAQRQRQRYDLVVASYVLGEVGEAGQRELLVRKLWELAGDVLVLVEPGTPTGAANILEARAQVLVAEARRAGKLARKVAAAGNGDGEADPHMRLKARRYGAHVVAPCGHDGACPMAGSRAWCHFGQAFHRPGWMQAAKAPPGSGVSAFDHQDERFSYVVLRRGARPGDVPEISISRSFERQLQLRQQAQQVTRELSAAPAAPVPVGHQQVQQHEQEQEQRQQQQDRWQQQVLNPATAGHPIPDGVLALMGRAPLRQRWDAPPAGGRRGDTALRVPLDGSDAPQGGDGASSSDDGAEGSDGGGGSERGVGRLQGVSLRLGPFGAGLVDRLVQLEDRGVDWAAAGRPWDTLDLDALHLAQQPLSAAAEHATTRPGVTGLDDAAAAGDASARGGQAGMLVGPADAVGAGTAAPRAPVAACGGPAVGLGGNSAADSSADEEADAMEARSGTGGDGEQTGRQLGAGLRADSWVPQDANSFRMAAASSSRWSRIIRPPRKRGGHIILDVCTPGPSLGGGAAIEQGALERHIVAKSDAQHWMGPAGWQLAKQAAWGDLWPGFYRVNRRVEVVQPPPASGSRNGDSGDEGAAVSAGNGAPAAQQGGSGRRRMALRARRSGSLHRHAA